MNARFRAELVQQQLVVKLAQEGGRAEALRWLQEKHGVSAETAEVLVGEAEQLRQAQVRRDGRRGMWGTAPALLLLGGYLWRWGPTGLLGVLCLGLAAVTAAVLLAHVVMACTGQRVDFSLKLTGGE